jgi:hypothetical protein
MLSLIYIVIFFILLFYTYTKWQTFSNLKKIIFTILDIIFSSMSFKDFKNIFMSYDKYLEEINKNN